MSTSPAYSSAIATRSAMSDFSRSAAAEYGMPVQQVQRFICFDRLLTRLYMVADDWTVKGAFALLSRDLGTRGTIDLDLHRRTELPIAASDLRRALQLDIGDHFTFEETRTRSIVAEGTGIKFNIEVRIGLKSWSSFELDLVGGELTLTGVPTEHPPMFKYPRELVQHSHYLLFPLADHTADKLFGVMYRRDGRDSTRFKDLADLVTISSKTQLNSAALRKAIDHLADDLSIDVKSEFNVPDTDVWQLRYEELASHDGLPVKSFDAAMTKVKSFLEPVLSGMLGEHTWNPVEQQWETVGSAPNQLASKQAPMMELGDSISLDSTGSPTFGRD